MAAPIRKQLFHIFRRKSGNICLSKHFDVHLKTRNENFKLCYMLNSTTQIVNAPDSSTKSQKLIAQRQTAKEIKQDDTSEMVLREMDIGKNDLEMPEVDLKNLRPSLKSAGNIAAYVRHSDALTKLVELGVDLSIIEKDAKATDMFVKFDFEKNIKPYLIFLNSLKVPNDLLAQCITRNPMIFGESLNDLQLRIDYLKSKKFSDEGIVALVTRAPHFLNLSTKEIDGRLGYFQTKFNLTGEKNKKISVFLICFILL